MSKISFIAKQYSILFFVQAILLFVAHPAAFASNISEADLEQRVENLNSAVDVRYTSTVQMHIKQYTKNNKKGTQAILGRAALYFPMFEQILNDKNLPQDLKYLAIVESGLKPTATSKVGAAGMWQFMKGTGRMMGLKVNGTIDERRDPAKSTTAAADYLSYLHEKFGDWTVALAAYNCGPGNVRKAIRRSGGKTSFWEIEKYLPRETRNYVPKFIAVSYIMNYYYDHNLVPQMPEDGLLNTATAQVYNKVSLRTLSRETGLDLKLIKKLNPAYIRNYIPESKEGKYFLTLPQDHLYEYVNQTQSATLILRPYTLKAKDNKVTSANRSRQLFDINYLPASSSKATSISKTIHTYTPLIARTISYRTTRLNIRESLKDVADRTGTTVDELLQLNAYDDQNRPSPGSIVKYTE